jgi:hypothetical protein
MSGPLLVGKLPLISNYGLPTSRANPCPPDGLLRQPLQGAQPAAATGLVADGRAHGDDGDVGDPARMQLRIGGEGEALSRTCVEPTYNDATRSLVRMLPITIDMRDHLRQEKTGNLPSALPAIERQLDFSIAQTRACQAAPQRRMHYIRLASASVRSSLAYRRGPG